MNNVHRDSTDIISVLITVGTNGIGGENVFLYKYN